MVGTASQTITNRWGDYSSMNVDPSDDTTFWYTNEYLTSSAQGWRTRIGAFQIQSLVFVEPGGSCGGNTPCYTTIGAAMGAAVSGSTIKIAEGSYAEDLLLNTSKNLTLQGGWNSAFTARSSNSTVNTITISSGSITADYLVVQ